MTFKPNALELRVMRAMLFGEHSMTFKDSSPEEQQKILTGPIGHAAWLYAKAAIAAMRPLKKVKKRRVK